MRKKKKKKNGVSWLKRLNTKLDMMDAQMDFKLYPMIITASCFILIVLIIILCIMIYG